MDKVRLSRTSTSSLAGECVVSTYKNETGLIVLETTRGNQVFMDAFEADNFCKWFAAQKSSTEPLSRYTWDIPNYNGDLMTVEDWQYHIDRGAFNAYDGDGYWCREGKRSEDSVWLTSPGDATHVIWFNK